MKLSENFRLNRCKCLVTTAVTQALTRKTKIFGYTQHIILASLAHPIKFMKIYDKCLLLYIVQQLETVGIRRQKLQVKLQVGIHFVRGQ